MTAKAMGTKSHRNLTYTLSPLPISGLGVEQQRLGLECAINAAVVAAITKSPPIEEAGNVSVNLRHWREIPGASAKLS